MVLNIEETDGGVIYTLGNNTFEINGEQDAGEAWLKGKWMYYELNNDTGMVCFYSSDDKATEMFALALGDEDEWEAFARKALA